MVQQKDYKNKPVYKVTHYRKNNTFYDKPNTDVAILSKNVDGREQYNNERRPRATKLKKGEGDNGCMHKKKRRKKNMGMDNKTKLQKIGKKLQIEMEI